MAASVIRDIDLTEKRLLEIADIAYEWVLYHGLVLKDNQENPEDNTIRCIPFSLFPSLVPASVLEEAKSTMSEYNRVIHRAAHDHVFLSQCLRTVVGKDAFMSRLWSIYLQVREAGIKQPFMLGLNRNDFMMECKTNREVGHIPRAEDIQLRHMEFHTISGCIGAFAQRLVELHKMTLDLSGRKYNTTEIPENKTSDGISVGLVRAWELYGNPKAVIVFLVGRNETNNFGQRWLEFCVYDHNPGIRILRKTLIDFHEYGSASGSDSRLYIDGDEVAVVYIQDCYKDGRLPTEDEWDGRLVIELSAAIKCPSVQYQLVSSPEIQQELFRPGGLDKFATSEHWVGRLTETYPSQLSLDLGSEGDETLEMAVESPENFVLKPQTDSSCTNVNGEEMRQIFSNLKALTQMQRIFPWTQQNFLMRHDIPFGVADVVNEIGIFGVYIGSADTEVENYECGHVLKTRRAQIDDGGDGIADVTVLDTPFLY